MGDSRKEFEEWCCTIFHLWVNTRDRDGYNNKEIDSMWNGWKAGRESILLELSEQEPVAYAIFKRSTGELWNYGGRLDTCKSYAKSALIPEYLEIGELVRRPLPPQNSKEGEKK